MDVNIKEYPEILKKKKRKKTLTISVKKTNNEAPFYEGGGEQYITKARKDNI